MFFSLAIVGILSSSIVCFSTDSNQLCWMVLTDQIFEFGSAGSVIVSCIANKCNIQKKENRE